MRSPYLFITTPLDNKRYNNTKKIGDVDFIISTSEENHEASNRKSGRSFFMENKFFIEPDQFYMYHDGKEWNTHGRYCFVKPVLEEEYYIDKNTKEEPLVGEIKYTNEYLRSQNVNPGDKVCFKPESEYEFQVDGEKLYRMFDHQITIKL